MRYRDKNGKETIFNTPQDDLLKRIYSSALGRFLIKPLTLPWLSKLGGRFLETRISSIIIKPFIKSNNINMSDYENRSYSSYNDFFTRTIAPGKRPVSDADIISPSDGKLSAYKISDDSAFRIKNSDYTLLSLLRNKSLSEKFKNGYAVIIRLTVDNYHRYCWCCDGIKSQNKEIRGFLHTVNPCALEHIKVFKENTREYCVIKTGRGYVLQMEVGALMVGKISNSDKDIKNVVKGQEKGCFEFGGSTIILLLDKAYKPLERFLKNTEDGFETLVSMGESISE